ncbi:hypothetical protein AB5I39_02350 [Sphingomonas sp. MMS24-J45]|uniref:hypothetical protein n=1 Tax=Sphingomonas sp. MMS24-J45 TaxID=3238806 RepID=UPI00384B4536
MRIFDVFPFDRELDMLEHRLRETVDLVDGVILIEASQTYRGDPKPLYFAAAAARFAWAKAKIRHVTLASLGGPEASPKERAARQRNAAVLALRDAAPDDILLLLDVDEIPDPALLACLRAEGLSRPRRLAMTRHYRFADRLAPRSPCCPVPPDPFALSTGFLKPGAWNALDPQWYGYSGVAVPHSALAEATPFDLRYRTPLDDPILRAGRHFNAVDPSARLEDKLGRMFHEEFDGARARSPYALALCRDAGVHHRGWWYAAEPEGELPDDVARLIARFPQTRAPEMPGPVVRRLVRSWAWLRLRTIVPGAIVRFVDRNFSRAMAVLAAPLLALDAGRALAAATMRLCRVRTAPRTRHHF